MDERAYESPSGSNEAVILRINDVTEVIVLKQETEEREKLRDMLSKLD